MATKLDLNAKREAVRKALDEYEGSLERVVENTPRGSGHAKNDYDTLNASIIEVKAARRVLWMGP